MRNLLAKLSDTANMSRLNTVEAAFAGTPGAQSNFKAKWQGYDENGNGIVKVNGVAYTANTIAASSIKQNYNVILRAGKGIKSIHW